MPTEADEMPREDRRLSRAGSTLLKAWEQGLSLPQALRCLGSGPRWTAARADVLSGFRAVTRTSASPLADRPGAIANLQGLAAAWEEQQRVRQALEERLAGALSEGVMVSVGFQQAGAGTQRLVVIPRSVWQDPVAIDWERSRLKCGANVILDVRVLAGSGSQPLAIPGPGPSAAGQ